MTELAPITTETPTELLGLSAIQLADITERLAARQITPPGGPVDQDIALLIQHNTYAFDLLLKLWDQVLYYENGALRISMDTDYPDDRELLHRIRAYLGVD